MAKKIRGQKAWRKSPSGSEKRKEVPLKVFLDKKNRRYPVMTWSETEGDYKYSKQQLRNAISVANSQGDKAISAKASTILAREFPKKDGYSYVEKLCGVSMPNCDKLATGAVTI